LKGDFYSENLLKLLVTIPFRDSRRKCRLRPEYTKTSYSSDIASFPPFSYNSRNDHTARAGHEIGSLFRTPHKLPPRPQIV